METKLCCKCHILRNKTDFGKLKASPDGLRYDCKSCRKVYRDKNRETINLKLKEYYENNKETLIIKNKQYRLKNTENIIKQRAQYRNRPEIKEHIKQKNKEYLPIKKEKIKLKRKTDKNFQLSEILRSKIHKMIKGLNTTYMKIIGCDLNFLKKWIEFRFTEEMTWDNLGTYWQIDHILPINAFNFEDDERNKHICFHWTNLQPLQTGINKTKTNKIQMHHVLNNIVNVNRFNLKYNNFLGYQTLNESLRWLREKLRYGKNPSHDGEKSLEIDNPQPSHYVRYDKDMWKVQRLDGSGSEYANHI